jgi:hypothetical protein
MAISVVNGYLCMNGCDAAKARTGQDPHASTTTAQSGPGGASHQTNDAATNAAVVYGGILASLNGNYSANPAATTANPSQTRGVNVVA